MNIVNAHYDFKIKINKIDSEQYRNLLVPEIDWLLNSAQLLIVKAISNPRHAKRLERYGFELNQRNIDDLSPLVVNDFQPPLQEKEPGVFVAELPDEYLFHISSSVIASKGVCDGIKFRTTLIQHDDLNNQKDFYKSSFLWRRVNIRFYDGGIKIFTGGDFTITSFLLNYIKYPPRVHAASLTGGTYKLPDGTILTGDVNFILPKHLIPEVVDLAVILATIDLQIPDIQVKNLKQTFN